ncbi:hypothetical protein L1049_018564 [Liquidambar formosana]|uniref:BURP domain-containing protein n=1 Tax=Liquidambar formosana TaxID=63359 RepID=A0AAP0RA95_LIQFO
MEFHLLPIFTFLCLVLVVSHASLPSEVYWQTVLPNTPMPKALRDLLQPGKSTSVSFSKERIDALTKFDTRFTYPDKVIYTYPEEQPQQDGPILDSYFLGRELHTGTKMKLYFTKIANGATFLPREVAESIPFSSTKLPDILNRFAVKPKSAEAQIMEKTMKECEEPGIEGETKYCATSLESLIDFTTLELGKNVQAISTEVDAGIQEYKIGGAVKMVGEEAVVCHKQKYVYAVFYCHATQGTKTYMVPLVDVNGKKSKAVAICHTDTSNWSPELLVFQVLKVKPGRAPICHFLPNGNIVWVSN